MTTTNSSTTIPLSAELGYTHSQVIQQVRADLHSNILDIVCYGVYTCIYIIAVHSILSSSRRISKGRAVHLGLITLMWILYSIQIPMALIVFDEEFIKHGQDLETKLDNDFIGGSSTIIFLLQVPLMLVRLLGDSIIIWRCYKVYGNYWAPVILPSTCLLGFFGIGVLRLVTEVAASLEGGVLQLWLVDAYFILSTLTNLICTSLIVFRIIRVNRGAQKRYRFVIEILVESALMLAISNLLLAILTSLSYSVLWASIVAEYWAIAVDTIGAIAPTLILARVASGAARPDDSWYYEGSGVTSVQRISNRVISAIRFRADPRELVQSSSSGIESTLGETVGRVSREDSGIYTV